MKRSAIEISREILDNFPETAIGYTVVTNLHCVVNSSKLDQTLTDFKKHQLPNGLSVDNLVDLPTIARWRSVYAQSGVKPKTYKSSIESLLRRFIKSEYSPIIPLVDFYNYISVKYMLSAGGYNWSAITGTLTLRYSKDGDSFKPLSGKVDIPLDNKHIVYADEDISNNVICWMWNHKDSVKTMLTDNCDAGLFIFDSLAIEDHGALSNALSEFNRLISDMGGDVKSSGILDLKQPLLVL